METNVFTTFINACRTIGFDVMLIIAGMAGGVVLVSKPAKLTRWQKATTVLSGGLTANYLTPLVASWLHLSDQALCGLAFLLGYGGLKGVEMLWLYLNSKFKTA